MCTEGNFEQRVEVVRDFAFQQRVAEGIAAKRRKFEAETYRHLFDAMVNEKAKEIAANNTRDMEAAIESLERVLKNEYSTPRWTRRNAKPSTLS